jgi:hypothetical protein
MLFSGMVVLLTTSVSASPPDPEREPEWRSSCVCCGCGGEGSCCYQGNNTTQPSPPVLAFQVNPGPDKPIRWTADLQPCFAAAVARLPASPVVVQSGGPPLFLRLLRLTI